MSGVDYAPRWVQATEARQMLGGMSDGVLRKLGREGVIRMCKPAGRVMYRVEDIDNLDQRIIEIRTGGQAGTRRRRHRAAAGDPVREAGQ
ncbi:hypothetical protein [Bifidobacterium simiiventris]|uniref:hypothetical protein n=1 Tax=Bifidobacterium simiiventris TaxID=2834434 RepID=UPI001C59B780|nr:hypothetical protein [Bifidobacterium simiiventris]MBW3077726.1 hypothetical protein [Bifidobacterium simiiventris]